MDLKNYEHNLRLNSLFKHFPYEELSCLFNESNHRITKYKKNSILHFAGEKCSSLDLVLEGELIVQKIDENGNVLTITKFNVGNALGGNLLFGNNSTYPMTICAKSDAVVLHIKKDLILQLCQTNKNFLVEFLKHVCNTTFILTNRIKSISIKSLRESIIDFLNYEYYYQKTTKIKLSMTKKELAERLGVQRTSLSRELNKMKKDGLVVYDTSSITIKDLNILKK